MNGAKEKASVVHIDQLDLVFSPKPWDFAEKRRSEIDAWFAARQRENPALWNGRVLLLHEQNLAKGIFRGRYLETDFASFTAWRQWGRPPAAINDCFAAAAILAADGAFLLGVMGPHTINAGRTYFPCGTPDQKDIYGTRVDLDLSMRRELKEETGLDVADFAPEPGWTSIFDGSLIAHIKVLKSNDDARTLRARISDHLAREQQPELADIRIVRGPDDFDLAMPRFVTAFLTHRFAVR
jgi:8-oxo-dGTP pyrophosphatase MutT (NUDIX family)